MDAFELFRKLGAGAKFDLKRFGQDAARFKTNRPKGADASDPLSSIDYFGKFSKTKLQLEEDNHEEDEILSEESDAGTKRKRKDNETDVKTNKRKKKKPINTGKSYPCSTSYKCAWL